MADLSGQFIDQRYEVLELLDEGGMAMVYRTVDTRLNRVVALKIIPKEKFNKEQLEEILQRLYLPCHYRGKSIKMAEIIQIQVNDMRSFLDGSKKSYLPFICKW